MKELKGNFYTTEHDESIIDFIEDYLHGNISIYSCDGVLECVGGVFYQPITLEEVEADSVKLSKFEFMQRIGMPVSTENMIKDLEESEYTFEDCLLESRREKTILKAENQMFKDNIRVLKEHVNLLQERLDIAQNNCKIRETLQSNAEQHNYVTAKKFNETLSENHELKQKIKELESK